MLANRDGQPNAVHLNGKDQQFGKAVAYGTGTDNTRSVALADLNGDGHLDIVAANVEQSNRVFFNNGKGAFTKSIAFGDAKAPSYTVATGDLDLDGDVDIVIGNSRQKNVIYFNEAQGIKFRSVAFGQIAGTYSVEVGDLNGDKFLILWWAILGLIILFILIKGSRVKPVKFCPEKESP